MRIATKTIEPKRTWRYKFRTVKANTKSEARSILKRQSGLKRLPAGTVIVEVT